MSGARRSTGTIDPKIRTMSLSLKGAHVGYGERAFFACDPLDP